jgi:GntR family transcriptional regulator
MSIDRNSPFPLYFQLKQIIMKKLDARVWVPGDILPSEKEFQAEYKLSRTTVRQALKELEAEGRLSRHRGRGTFVTQPKVTHGLEPRNSLTAYLEKMGQQPGWQLLSAEWVRPPDDVAMRLGISPDARTFCLSRLRLADGEPLGFHIAYVSPNFAELINPEQFQQGGSLSYLQSSSLLADCCAQRTFEAVGAREEEATLLGVARGAPMFQIRRLLLTSGQQPIEDLRAIYRGDRFQYVLNQLP